MVRFALKTPYTIIVVCLDDAMVLGLFSMFKLPMDILPTFRIPAVMVVTTYTGMPAEMIETDITNRLERWLSQASGLDYIESRSMIGVSILNLFLPVRLRSQQRARADQHARHVGPALSAARYQPPIVIAYDPTAGSARLVCMTIFTPGLDEAKLWDESNYIVRNQINAVPGAVAPVVFGGKFRQMMVYLDKDRLSGYGISPMEVVNAFSHGNCDDPDGRREDRQVRLTVSAANGMVPSIAEFDKIPIKVVNGAPVFVKDVGQYRGLLRRSDQRRAGQSDQSRPIFRFFDESEAARSMSWTISAKAIPQVLDALPPAVRDRARVRPVAQGAGCDRRRRPRARRRRASGRGRDLSVSRQHHAHLDRRADHPAVDHRRDDRRSITRIRSLNLMTLGGLALITGPLIDKAVVALENIERHLDIGAQPRGGRTGRLRSAAAGADGESRTDRGILSGDVLSRAWESSCSRRWQSRSRSLRSFPILPS